MGVSDYQSVIQAMSALQNETIVVRIRPFGASVTCWLFWWRERLIVALRIDLTSYACLVRFRSKGFAAILSVYVISSACPACIFRTAL